ncbi:hypothetical protein [Klebsiella phage 05F01]|nr:hypothetical protein [Klebsiella phage 05F01]
MKTITLTPLELITIMEDAFIDGWNKAEQNEWWDPKLFLELYKEEGDSSETTTAIEDIKEEYNVS